VIAPLCASAVLLAAFIRRERRAACPLLDLRFLLVLAAGLLALITLRSRPAPAGIVNSPVIPSDRGSGQPQGPVRRK
jgi:hypothetical protein